jgi:nicotinamide-nucleotide amidase
MQAEIIMIGTELLLGQIIDTNASFIAQVLAENGINLYQKTTVGDNPHRIIQCLEAALERADVVLTSGGLGPTEDDITRECIAEVFGKPLELRPDLVEQIEARFQRIGRRPSTNNLKQAHAPTGAVAIENRHGTAPGLILEDPRGIVIAMPGVPQELKPMLRAKVLPFLRKRFNLKGVVHYRVLKVCGVGESTIDNAIGHLIRDSENPTVGLLASPDAVKIRIAARADTKAKALTMIDAMAAQIHQLLPGLIMGADDETLEEVIDELLKARGWRLALAETHTGGMIAQRLTFVGASSFAGGIITQAPPASASDAARHARELADQARRYFNVESAFASVPCEAPGTAVAVFVTPDESREWELRFSTLSENHQLRAAIACLEHLRRYLAPPPDRLT